MNNKIQDIFIKTKNKLFRNEIESIYTEDFEMITDEIEKSLATLKEPYDIPTEEIEKSILSRRELREKRKASSR